MKQNLQVIKLKEVIRSLNHAIAEIENPATPDSGTHEHYYIWSALRTLTKLEEETDG
jgi:hypothetical protein